VNIDDNHAAVAPQGFVTEGFAVESVAAQADTTAQGFTTEDILWALGIWSVILSLSPVIVFYMLMVA
jgi:hypothetical protein